MSIKIHNGYRIRLGATAPFLRNVEAAVAPVRNELDATLYASIVADLIDRHDQGTYRYVESLKLDALHEFMKVVGQGPVGTVFNHPHSFDLDIGFDPDTDPQATDRWLHVLLHCQRDEYQTIFESLPGVEPFPYWNNSDRPDDLDDEAWNARHNAWKWVIDARRIRDVMTRWTHRDNPSPEGSYILRDDIILDRLPTIEDRANRIAGDQATSEHFTDPEAQPDMNEVLAVLNGPRTRELAAEHAARLRIITTDDLHKAT